MEIKKLDAERLGEILLRVPLISMQLSHKYIRGSVRDYVSPGIEDLDAQFVRDLFTLETQQIIDKWYGGKEGAAELILKIK